MSSTILISLPTGSKIFNWLCTYLNRCLVHFNTLSIIYIKMFLIMFSIGGSSGLILGNSVIDICLHDTYYVVSHWHVGLSLGTILSMFIGVSYFQDLVLLRI